MTVLTHVSRTSYRAVRPLALNERDGSVLLQVPGGEFEMGDGEDSDCPKHRVQLDAYYIGMYCVTNRQYAEFVRATGHSAPDVADYGKPVWKNGRCPGGKLDHPVVCVSWEDAGAYAKWVGCRLPTEAEWEHAARGAGGLMYPWGNEWDASKCRNEETTGNEQTCAVWGYGGGVSGFGTYQQSGNVWEWCGDWFGDYPKGGVVRNPTGPDRGSRRVLRGGSWGNGDASCVRGADRCDYVPAGCLDNLDFRLARTA